MKDQKCPSCLAGFSREDVLGNCTCPAPLSQTGYELNGVKHEGMFSGSLKEGDNLVTFGPGGGGRKFTQTERECCKHGADKGKCWCNDCEDYIGSQRSDWRERFDQQVNEIIRAAIEGKRLVEPTQELLALFEAERENVRREVLAECIKLADETEPSDTSMDELRGFKHFRNALRDRLKNE